MKESDETPLVAHDRTGASLKRSSWRSLADGFKRASRRVRHPRRSGRSGTAEASDEGREDLDGVDQETGGNSTAEADEAIETDDVAEPSSRRSSWHSLVEGFKRTYRCVRHPRWPTKTK